MDARLWRLSTVLMWASRAGLVLLPAGVGWVMASWLGAPGTLADSLPGPWIRGPLAPPVAALGVAVLFAPVVPALYSLWQMQALFALYRAGETLTPAAALRIHRIGAGVFAVAIAGVLARPLASVILSSANPPGERMLAISLSSNDAGLALAGGLMTAIGWIMRDAARIAEENRGFV